MRQHQQAVPRAEFGAQVVVRSPRRRHPLRAAAVEDLPDRADPPLGPRPPGVRVAAVLPGRLGALRAEEPGRVEQGREPFGRTGEVVLRRERGEPGGAGQADGLGGPADQGLAGGSGRPPDGDRDPAAGAGDPAELGQGGAGRPTWLSTKLPTAASNVPSG